MIDTEHKVTRSGNAGPCPAKLLIIRSPGETEELAAQPGVYTGIKQRAGARPAPVV